MQARHIRSGQRAAPLARARPHAPLPAQRAASAASRAWMGDAAAVLPARGGGMGCGAAGGRGRRARRGYGELLRLGSAHKLLS